MGLQEDIQERINSRLTINANLLEGGFSQDIIGSVAYELANVQEVQIPDVISNGFVATADREHLILKGQEYGLPIRKATASTVILRIEGEVGAIVSSDVKAVYNNLTFTVSDFNKIGSSGIILVEAKCDILGSIGNVPENTIDKFLISYEGLTSVSNPAPSYGGYDEEETETYRDRLLEYNMLDASNANASQYKIWAQSVAGVSKAIVQSAEIVGAGNVGVFISSIDGEVTEQLKTNVLNYIESVQPINATVIVDSLTPVPISVNAQCVLSEGTSTDDVKEEFTTELERYFRTVQTTVSYIKVADLLLNCSGVIDVTSYTLNGGTQSIEIAETESPEVGNVVIIG